MFGFGFGSVFGSVWIVAGMAAGLYLLALGNETFLRSTEVALGVNWIYLPAGLRMCYVLVLPIHGAVAIFTATLLLALRDPTLTPLLVAVNGAVTALGPALARIVAVQRMGLQPNLANLNTRMLWTLAALFGFFSTSLHQAFFSALGREPAFLSMWIGDTIGCLLCLYGLKGLAMAARHWWPR